MNNKRIYRRGKGASPGVNTTTPDSELEGPPCICGKQLLNPKPLNYRQQVQCRVSDKMYDTHSSCLEYPVQENTKLFMCKACFFLGCYCTKKHNGGEPKILKDVCDVPHHDVSKKPHWYHVFQTCLPAMNQVPSKHSKGIWQCWECAPENYPSNTPITDKTSATSLSSSTGLETNSSKDSKLTISPPSLPTLKDIPPSKSPPQLVASETNPDTVKPSTLDVVMPLTPVSSSKMSTTPDSSKERTHVTTKSQIPPSPEPSHAQIPIYDKPPLNHGISKVALGESLPTKNKVKQSAKDVIRSNDVLLQIAIEERKLPFLFFHNAMFRIRPNLFHLLNPVTFDQKQGS
eukprot:scaffold23329_cov66-Attheya_sp.AAC.3